MLCWNGRGASAGRPEQRYGSAGGVVAAVVGLPAGDRAVWERDPCGDRDNGANLPDETMNRQWA